MAQDKLIGIDLGGTTTKFALLTQTGKIVDKWSIKTQTEDHGSQILPNMIASIQAKLEEWKLTSQDILGIGMGSPGSVDRKAGTVVGAYNLNWQEVQAVKTTMEEELGLDFYLDNDANVAALGEQWQGAGDQDPNLVFMTLGTGVGGGIILDNQLVHGAHDTAGEIGHLTVSNDRFDFPCTCGKSGCLESIASASGIVKVAQQMLAENKGQSQLYQVADRGDLEAKVIFDLAKQGDDLALLIVDIVCDYLAFAAGNIANIVNPSVIVIGGGVSQAGAILKETVEKHLADYLFPPLRDKTRVKIAQLESDAGVIGAGSLVLKEKLA